MTAAASPTAGPRVAWVESPLQLLNAVEYGAATGEQVAITPRAGIGQLPATVDAIQRSLPPSVTVTAPVDVAQRSDFVRTARRLIGDAYSGQFRMVAARGDLGDLVVVDDGAITVALVEQLATGAPLSRPGVAESATVRMLGRAAAVRLRRAAQRGTLSLFTAYVDQVDQACAGLGVRMLRNSYDWIQTADAVAGSRAEGHLVLGTALADDGLISASEYEAWIAAMAADGPVTYFPHRRERDESLLAYAALEGVTVREATIPIELVVASSPHVTRVDVLPSSVVATLPSVLAPTARLHVSGVPESWWTDAADPGLRANLRTVGRMGGQSEG